MKTYRQNDKLLLEKNPRLNYYNGFSSLCIIGPYALSAFLPMSNLATIILLSILIVACCVGWFFLRKDLLKEIL